jgi:hypothetical protein
MATIWFVITTLIGGLVIGLLGKIAAPGGKDDIKFLQIGRASCRERVS